MRLKEVLNRSYYGTIGYLGTTEDLMTLLRFIEGNKSILREFKGHIFTFTHNGFDKKGVTDVIQEMVPGSVVLFEDVNRGHTFGTMDLDNMLVRYCKENSIDWLCKTSSDVYLTEDVLEIEVGNVDFYYLNGIGYGGYQKLEFNPDRAVKEVFFPQTNFYVINTSKIDYLVNASELDSTFEKVVSTSGYNNKPWEYVKNWTCEYKLKECSERNKLTKEHLLSDSQFKRLLKVIEEYQIHDPSHKNILINGICHLQYTDQPVIKL